MNAAAAQAHPPKVMGLFDLVLFYVVTGVSLRWVAAAAAGGPSSIVIWVGALICFYAPLALAVAELSSRYPQEGGLYVWTRQAFGPFVGFMVGWSYFASNLPYFPAVFYFDAGNALFIGGDRLSGLKDSPAFFMIFALAALALITALNVFGLKIGKWMHNIGAAGMWLPTLIMVVMGVIAWRRFGSATHFSVHTMTPTLSIKDMVFWSSLAFALSGAETASFMSGEIKDARRTIPRALVVSGSIIAVCYVAGTFAVLLALQPQDVSPLQGLIQAAAATAGKLGVAWIVVPLAVLITVGNLGAASGFLAACARIPYAVGIDRMLPQALGRTHPRWGTPYVALLVQGGLGAVFVILGQAGTGVKGAYEVLVSMGIISAFLPFAMVFLSVIRLQREPAGPGVFRLPGGAVTSIAVACVGLTTTSISIVLAVLPAADEPNKPLAVAKIVGLTGVMLGAGWLIHVLGGRQARRAAAAETAA